MDWNAVGAIGEIVGAMAVIATLLYLAQQIKHNTHASNAEQNRAVMMSFADVNNIIIANRDTADLLAKMGRPATNDLTPGEQVQVTHLTYRFINAWHTVQTAHYAGQMSRADFETYKKDVRNILEMYPGLLPSGAEICSHNEMLNMEIYEPFAEYAARTK